MHVAFVVVVVDLETMMRTPPTTHGRVLRWVLLRPLPSFLLRLLHPTTFAAFVVAIVVGVVPRLNVAVVVVVVARLDLVFVFDGHSSLLLLTNARSYHSEWSMRV